MGNQRDYNLTVELVRDGKVLETHRRSNKVTNVGRQVCRDLLCNAGPCPRSIALGTGATAPAATDIALETERFRNGVTRIYTEESKVVYQLFVATDQANGYAYTEFGLFAEEPVAWTSAVAGLAAGSGQLFARATLAGLSSKTSADTLVVTWEVPIQSTE